MIDDRPFTPETLAARWNCSPETVRQMVHRRELPAFRVGRLIRIARADVDAFESGDDAARNSCDAVFG